MTQPLVWQCGPAFSFSPSSPDHKACRRNKRLSSQAYIHVSVGVHTATTLNNNNITLSIQFWQITIVAVISCLCASFSHLKNYYFFFVYKLDLKQAHFIISSHSHSTSYSSNRGPNACMNSVLSWTKQCIQCFSIDCDLRQRRLAG